MKKVKYLAIITITLLASVSVERAEAQSFSLRNNLLYDATLTPNLGFDLRLGSQWTMGANVGLNAWDINRETNKKWRHVLVAPNVRYWVGDSLFYKGYVEGDLIYSHYNVGNTTIPFGLYQGAKDKRLQGDLFALGAKYGYSWILDRFWRIEAEAGLAFGYTWFDEYDCPTCGSFLGKNDRFFFMPLLGINIVYIFN